MELTGSVLLKEINALCINRLLQTGELASRWKSFNMLPLAPDFGVWRFSSCFSTALFAMTKCFLFYSDLKGHRALPMSELRGFTWTQRRFSLTESNLNGSVLVQPCPWIQHNSQACVFGREMRWLFLVCLVLFTGTTINILAWDLLRHMNTMILLPHWCWCSCMALQSAVVGILAQCISCFVFSIGADLCDAIWILFIFIPIIFLPSAHSSKRKKKTKKWLFPSVCIKPTN